MGQGEDKVMRAPSQQLLSLEWMNFLDCRTALLCASEDGRLLVALQAGGADACWVGLMPAAGTEVLCISEGEKAPIRWIRN